MSSTVTINTTGDADFVHAFQYQAGGVNVDLSTTTAMVMAVKDQATGAIGFTISLTDYITLVDTVNGKFQIRFPFAYLSKLAPGVYNHSLVRTLSSGLREEMWNGTINHTAGVS